MRGFSILGYSPEYYSQSKNSSGELTAHGAQMVSDSCCCSDCETFPASAGSGSIGIVKIKTFSIQAIRKFQAGIYQV